jgi:acetyltransferase-like isoleucine patch superfamily enzyme
MFGKKVKYYLKKLGQRAFNKFYKNYKVKELYKYKNEKELLISRLHSVGFGLKLNGRLHYISSPNKVILGNNVHIGDNCYLKTEGGLTIGHNCHISRNLTLYTVNHDYNGAGLPYDSNEIFKPVVIGDNVWVGMNVSIMPGISIGEGAIIALGTIVNRDVKPYEVVGPALIQTIKYRDVNHYELLKHNKAFGGVNGELLLDTELTSFLPTYKDFKDRSIVFVLSTGRSGSLSITNILNQHPDCKAFHEDIMQLIRISTELAYNITNKKLQQELLAIFETKVWNASTNQLIVHSDQRLWNLVPFLASYFTKSKFIHLVRQPESCISSMVARNWYLEDEYKNFNKHDWAKFRLQADKLGDIGIMEWSKLTNIQKCIWYYFYINDYIKNELNKLSADRSMRLQLETLDVNIFQLQEFLGLKTIDLKVVKINSVKPEDKVRLERLSKDTIRAEIEFMKEQFNLKVKHDI